MLDYDVFSGSVTDAYSGTPFGCPNPVLAETATRGTPGAISVNIGTLRVHHFVALTQQDFVMRVAAGDVYDGATTFGGPYETYTTTGGCSPEPDVAVANRWARIFDFVGTRDTRTNAPDAPIRPYQLTGFTRGAVPVYLQRTKRDTGNVGGVDFNIETTIRIVHTPIRVG